MGVIAVETRTVEVTIPADPANPESEAKVSGETIVGRRLEGRAGKKLSIILWHILIFLEV